MKTYLYKNITDQETMLVGYGLVSAGKTIEIEKLIDSPNLELVETVKRKDVNKEKQDD